MREGGKEERREGGKEERRKGGKEERREIKIPKPVFTSVQYAKPSPSHL
jgi:hypothetical protein